MVKPDTKGIFTWDRTVKNGKPFYEVSSKGDKRFSAFWAILKPSGFSIEEVYMLDIKGYRKEYEHKVKDGIIEMDEVPFWKYAKGKPSLNNPDEDLYPKYLDLWVQWANQNKKEIQELYTKAKGKTLTDMFASSKMSQARALCDILNTIYLQRKSRGLEG